MRQRRKVTIRRIVKSMRKERAHFYRTRKGRIWKEIKQVMWRLKRNIDAGENAP